MIVWLTGESGAGKTTLAKKFKKEFPFCLILDGDDMRDSISDEGFDRAGRRLHNLRVARLAKTLEPQILIMVSVIAPIQSVRDEIDEICRPIWVHVKRTIPAREGHFYEEPLDVPAVDHDTLGVDESYLRLKQILAFSFATEDGGGI